MGVVHLSLLLAWPPASKQELATVPFEITEAYVLLLKKKAHGLYQPLQIIEGASRSTWSSPGFASRSSNCPLN